MTKAEMAERLAKLEAIVENLAHGDVPVVNEPELVAPPQKPELTDKERATFKVLADARKRHPTMTNREFMLIVNLVRALRDMRPMSDSSLSDCNAESFLRYHATPRTFFIQGKKVSTAAGWHRQIAETALTAIHDALEPISQGGTAAKPQKELKLA